MADMKLFAGNATPELAKKIAARLYTRLGNATVGRFSGGEVQVQQAVLPLLFHTSAMHVRIVVYVLLVYQLPLR